MKVPHAHFTALLVSMAAAATGLAQTISGTQTTQFGAIKKSPTVNSSTVTIQDPQPVVQAEPAIVATPEQSVAAPANGGGCCESDPCADPCCSTSRCGGGCFENGLSLEGLCGVNPCSPWNFGGWTQAGYTNNNIPLSQAYNDLLSFNDVPDHFHLNQQWFYGEHVARTNCGVGFGGRIDAAYGTDAQKIQAFGNPGAGVRGFGTYDASLDDGEYGWAVPQAYGEIATCNWSIKVGKWFSPAGYERIPSPQNFFYTHSYAHFNDQAFSHTGVLGEFNVMEDLTWYAGWALGWDTGFDQLNQGNCYVGGFDAVLTPRTTFKLINTFGNFGWRDGGDDNSHQHSFTLIHDVSCRLQVVLQADILDTSNPGVSEFDVAGLTNYLYYQLSENVRFGTRLEWWKADGVSFNEATMGLNVLLARNLRFRPEVRRDWAPGIGLDEITQYSADFILTY